MSTVANKVTNPPAKILLSNTTGLSLHDRFTKLARIRRQTPNNTTNTTVKLDKNSLIRQSPSEQKVASAKNRRLALQMANRPSVRAALRIKKKSIRQRLGVSSNAVGLKQNENIRKRLSGGFVRPRLNMNRRGNNNMNNRLMRPNNRLNISGNSNNPNNSMNSNGSSLNRSNQNRRNGNMMRRRGGINKNYGINNNNYNRMGLKQRLGQNRNMRRGGANNNRRGVNRGGMNMNRGGRRAAGGPNQQMPVKSREVLDQDLDKYMAKSKSHLDADIDVYMSQAN